MNLGGFDDLEVGVGVIGRGCCFGYLVIFNIDFSKVLFKVEGFLVIVLIDGKNK